MILTPGHRWNNADYYNHTGLEMYANYMFGGGYILSAGGAFCAQFAEHRGDISLVLEMLIFPRGVLTAGCVKRIQMAYEAASFDIAMTSATTL